ncbi:MAG TPA: 23S rRNA (adenine(2503)-C(2))-methyltransferase RlmN [Candidatus Omnitrophota bacterium]|nr:23S rRNA (adenine(2503)-C(2))-methyltransferase RlmN [Candidatus Omnitrophota bacterium]
MATTSLINILNLTPAELKDRFKALDLEPYRADQVLEWIYGKGVYEFDRMTNLSKELKDKLKASFTVAFPEEVREARSHQDKSVKMLLKLRDNDLVEAVYMPMEHRRTVCVSSQVGCKFHCAFCASGQNGFFRNLTMGEIVAQILMARDLSPEKKITNIVFMGIGEPFDNYTELLRTVRTLNAKKGLGLGARKITISTCGIVPKIESLSNEGLQIELSVSLHGATDRVRETIMPVNRAYPVKALLDACKRYIKKTKRAITFEYILIKGINASERDARELAKVLKGMLCKVNLIPYNPIEEFPHDQPNYPEIVRFQQILQEAGIRTTVRFSKGRDIQAACGQLRSVVTKQKV